MLHLKAILDKSELKYENKGGGDMDTLGLLLALVLTGSLVLAGVVLAIFGIQGLRKQISAGDTFKSEVIALSLRCFPLALGIILVAYGAMTISKVIGLGELAGGTGNTMASIALQSIPMVIIIFIAYTIRVLRSAR